MAFYYPLTRRGSHACGRARFFAEDISRSDARPKPCDSKPRTRKMRKMQRQTPNFPWLFIVHHPSRLACLRARSLFCGRYFPLRCSAKTARFQALDAYKVKNSGPNAGQPCAASFVTRRRSHIWAQRRRWENTAPNAPHHFLGGSAGKGICKNASFQARLLHAASASISGHIPETPPVFPPGRRQFTDAAKGLHTLLRPLRRFLSCVCIFAMQVAVASPSQRRNKNLRTR